LFDGNGNVIHQTVYTGSIPQFCDISITFTVFYLFYFGVLGWSKMFVYLLVIVCCVKIYVQY